MKRPFKIYLPLLLLLLFGMTPRVAQAQILPLNDREVQKEYADSLKREFDKGPYFSLYKDNYFVVGCPLGYKPTKYNSDVKFQISIAQRLTKSTLPWGTFLFLMYTQRVFWNVFENSLPMHDFIFNPGIGLTKPFFSKGKYIGKATLMLEHESNGRDGDASRSWNRISLSGSVLVTDWLMVHAKFWIPIIDGMNNRDILKYNGIWQAGFTVTSPNKKFIWDLTLVKRASWKPTFNYIFEFSWRPWKQANEYLFLQYYNGYGENLLDYNKFHSMIRAGIVIKPKFFSEM